MKPVRQVIILVGGLGTRLGSLTSHLPKPLLAIGGRPFLDYLLDQLRWQGMERVILATGFKSDIFASYAASRTRKNFRIDVVLEKEPLVTGGALKNCEHLADDRFLVMNGDTLQEVNLASFDMATAGECGLIIRYALEASRYGSVRVSEGKVIHFSEKGISGAGFISGGSCILTNDSLSWLPHGVSSIEKDLLTPLAANGKLAAFPIDGFFIDIGTPTSFVEAQHHIPNWFHKPIAFLDRDGVLNVDSAYVHSSTAFDWTEGAIEAVRYLNDSGYYVVLVTNQAGIAKGIFTEEDFHQLTAWMKERLWEGGAYLDAVYYCPQHKDGTVRKFHGDSYYRKPNPGMIFKAFQDLPSKFEGSFLVGDKHTDHLAAEAAGIPFCHYESGNLKHRIQTFLRT